ncbi:MipA/OmpV family protein [Sphingomonas sp. UNC305MFCol5.2]|uniref:MipA/OmpV family protein n=1 Tax=Sphingomonas sp. UNC305MFCol5.2 TaxID=1449076 RepID=UPI0003FA5CF3|nr:MipA/OmpV family protein [Sphingomonas sp. UNC305MFCol5.2]
MNFTKMMCGGVAAIMAVPLFFWSDAALAQATIPAEAEAAVPVQFEGAGNGEGGDHISIGIGGAYMPAYQGAKKYRFQPLPAIDIQFDRFFVNFQDGIGANLFDSESVTVGVGLTPAVGYRAKDAPPGIGKLSLGLGARGFVKLRQFGFEATLGTTKIFAGSTKGFLVDASLSHPVMISEKLTLNPSIGTTYGDRKHNNRYFGVTAQQSLASGLPQFRAGSGFIDAKADLGLQYRLTDRIGVGVVGGVTRLLGDVKDSPIVKRKTQPYGIAFVSYNF